MMAFRWVRTEPILRAEMPIGSIALTWATAVIASQTGTVVLYLLVRGDGELFETVMAALGVLASIPTAFVALLLTRPLAARGLLGLLPTVAVTASAGALLATLLSPFAGFGGPILGALVFSTRLSAAFTIPLGTVCWLFLAFLYPGQLLVPGRRRWVVVLSALLLALASGAIGLLLWLALVSGTSTGSGL